MASGGYRPGSGRAKTGYFKGIYCGSTYELAWVIYQLDHSLEFKLFDGFLESNGKKYFPDFEQNGKIVEIKGYEAQDKVDAKSEIARLNGYEVIVLRKKDLQTEFDWVSTQYKTKKFQSLYDDYKPKFEYVCAKCGISFTKDYRLASEKAYCSRAHSLSGNRKSSGHNRYTSRDAASVAIRPSP